MSVLQKIFLQIKNQNELQYWVDHKVCSDFFCKMLQEKTQQPLGSPNIFINDSLKSPQYLFQSIGCVCVCMYVCVCMQKEMRSLNPFITLKQISKYCESYHHQFISVQFSYSIENNCLRPHGLQHTRLPCPSTTPGTCSNSFPSNW